ncbi:MAG: hypothetical protein LBO66_12885 [Deltaproteobacteria bacterium]|nr:hypothetical protein [Deltaproteobacteria bacterium]
MASLIYKIIDGRKYYYIEESVMENGKPRIVKQVCLGTLEKIIEMTQRVKAGGIEAPSYSETFEFGASRALFDVSRRLGVVDIIDSVVGKGPRGLSVGESLTVAAINRAIAPVSDKASREDWFRHTVLPDLFPSVNEKSLSSQGLWGKASRLTRERARLIEDAIALKVFENYGIPADFLLFYNPKFINFNDSEFRSRSAADFKIAGLPLTVSTEFNAPLLRETIFDNANDAQDISQIIDGFQARLRESRMNPDITFVFDREKKSAANFDKILQKDPFAFNFVGEVSRKRGALLFETLKAKCIPLKGDNFDGAKAFRSKIEEYGATFTAIIVLKKSKFGNTVLFTNRDNWTNERIVSAFGARRRVEAYFKRLTGDKFISFIPKTHLSEGDIIVYGLICALAFILSSAIKLEFSRLGYNQSVDSILSSLSICQQIVNYYEKNNKTSKTYSLTPSPNMVIKYFAEYSIHANSAAEKAVGKKRAPSDAK